MIFDEDPARLEDQKKKYPQATVARSFQEVLESDVQLVTAAAIPNQRGLIGCQVMEHGKDYFTDKCPFTSLEQLRNAEAVAKRTGKKYMVYFSERLHVESAWHVDKLIQDGAIGKIVHMEIFGPHRLSKTNRPRWFFEKEQYGGILCDIASHQFDQFLHYARAEDAKVTHAMVDNLGNPDTPELEDVGHATLVLDTGAHCFSRVNWFTPDSMRGWGDGRTFITGTEGVIEIRKYFDFGRSDTADTIILANNQGEQVLNVNGKVGFPFFGQLILDCLGRTEEAMTQDHVFTVARLSLEAQAMADSNKG